LRILLRKNDKSEIEKKSLGDEGDLRQCQLATEPTEEAVAAGCSPAVHAVTIVCNHPSVAHCPGNAVPFRRRCYDVISDDPKSFSEAQADCQQRSAEGGHLVRNMLFSSLLESKNLHFHTHYKSNFCISLYLLTDVLQY
jgi:hypothetical protein